jgi:NADPH-dependent 2,4-dienoyl-CoA reductase/sulfur reductase-like enzyme/rhodanese-related sulfurtransferase
MPKRLVIVGGVAGGASAAAKARRTNEDIEIVMFESGPFMSFANCGLPYYVGGEIDSRDKLFVAHPQLFHKRFRIDVHLNTTVTGVVPAQQKVIYVGPNGLEKTLGYDCLILATGTVPIKLPIEGIDAPHIFACRTVMDVDAIMARLQQLLPFNAEEDHNPEAGWLLTGEESGVEALVIGGGFIGLECAEQLLHRGVKVILVEALDQIMSPLDREMTVQLQQALESKGAEIILSDLVTGFDHSGTRSCAQLKSGRQVGFDLAILGVGVRPNVELAKAAALELGETGAIAVDEKQLTSDPRIYAAGDNCESVFLPTGKKVNIPLAGPANKQGRVAGQNAALDLMDTAADDKRRLGMKGVLGTSIVRCGEVVAGGTGMTEKVALKTGVDVALAYNFGSHHAGYYPGAQPMCIKLVYTPEDGRLLGGQIVGSEGVDKRLDVLATAIYGGMTIQDLEQLDLAYAPPFGSAKDVVILTGMVAANTQRGESPSITPTELFQEMEGENPMTLIDVRTAFEYRAGRLKGAVNIPLEKLRERLEEIPKDKPVVTQCNVGYRSYIAQQILRQNGYRDVRNLSGGHSLAGLMQTY